MPDMVRDALIRVWSQDMRQNYGNVVVAEVLRRPVDATVLLAGDARHNQSFPNGAVLIDNNESLGTLATMIRARHHILVTIRSTPEFVWFPTAGYRSITDYWTIELAPWVDYLRAGSKSDDTIIREANHE